MNYELEVVEVTEKQPAKIYHLFLSHYHYMKPHFHHNIELVYLLKGSFLAHVNGRDTHVLQDSLFLVNTDQVHYFEMLEDSEMITILLSYDMLNNYEKKMNSVDFDLSLNSSQHALLQETIQTMDRYRKSHDTYRELKVHAALCEIAYILLTYFQKPKQRETILHREHIQSLLDYIENHYAEPLTLEQLSQYFHYSPSYLCRYFKKVCGISLFQYIKIIRLQHAFLDVCHSDDEISMIAYKHGFVDTKAFIKAFKEKYHQTPGAYRQSLGQ